jgi:hypothetical protein
MRRRASGLTPALCGGGLVPAAEPARAVATERVAAAIHAVTAGPATFMAFATLFMPAFATTAAVTDMLAALPALRHALAAGAAPVAMLAAFVTASFAAPVASFATFAHAFAARAALAHAGAAGATAFAACSRTTGTAAHAARTATFATRALTATIAAPAAIIALTEAFAARATLAHAGATSFTAGAGRARGAGSAAAASSGRTAGTSGSAAVGRSVAAAIAALAAGIADRAVIALVAELSRSLVGVLVGAASACGLGRAVLRIRAGTEDGAERQRDEGLFEHGVLRGKWCAVVWATLAPSCKRTKQQVLPDVTRQSMNARRCGDGGSRAGRCRRIQVVTALCPGCRMPAESGEARESPRKPRLLARCDAVGRRHHAAMTLPPFRCACAALALLCNPAGAAWQNVDAHGGMRFFQDPESQRRNGDVVRVWELIDFRSVQVRPHLKPFRSIRIQMEYDCRDELARRVTLSMHGGNLAQGEIVHDDTDYGTWRPVPPATAAAALLKAACGRR